MEYTPRPKDTQSADDEDEYVTMSSLKNNVQEDWTMCIHPRGSIYFYNAQRSVVVDVDIRIPANGEKVTEFCIAHSDVSLPNHMEAYMAYGIDSSISLFVNHKQCVAGYDHSKVVDNAIRNLSVDHLLRSRRHYWNYIMYHPSHRPCRTQGFRDAIDAIQSFYHGYFVDGSRQIAPFSKEECEQLLSLLHRLQDDGPEVLPSTASIIGWILRDVYSFRTAHRYGQNTLTELRAYRKSLQSPHEFAPQESYMTQMFLMFIMKGPFFGIPLTYLAHIKKASEFRGHVAGLRHNWEWYTHQLIREHSDFILISTVLLSATVGILTINDIGEVARVAAMLSAFASLGSITVGVFFVWRHQRNTQMPSSFTYLHNARNSRFGLSGHAIILSLPPVLLVWSLIGFTAAALAYTLQDVSRMSTSAWIVLAVFVVILAAMFVGIYTFSTIWSWRSQSPWWRSLCCWSTSEPVVV